MSDDKFTTLKEKLADWLGKNGYPLEMRVAQEFSRLGLEVRQSEYYKDPDTGKQREIDLIAHESDFTAHIVRSVTFCVECKMSKDKPWILFTNGSHRLPTYVVAKQQFTSQLGRQLWEKVISGEPESLQGIFTLTERAAYGVTRGFRDKDAPDSAYEALLSAVKAANFQAESSTKHSHRFWAMFDLVIPVVVVDGELFEYYLDEDDRLNLEEVREGVVTLRFPVGELEFSYVHVVRIEHLPQFIERALTSTVDLFSNESLASAFEIHKQLHAAPEKN